MGVLVLFLLGGGGLAIGALVLFSQSADQTVVAPTPALKVKETRPAPPTVAAPEPAPTTPEPAPATPEPAKPAPPEATPTISPSAPAKPKPRVTAPQPVPEPAPAAGTELATVLVEGAKATLRNGNGEHEPGALTPGTYELWVDFGGGPTRAAVLKAIAGKTVTYRCSRLKQTCATR